MQWMTITSIPTHIKSACGQQGFSIFHAEILYMRHAELIFVECKVKVAKTVTIWNKGKAFHFSYTSYYGRKKFAFKVAAYKTQIENKKLSTQPN